jgi:DNA-binding transcriptional MerR regulator
MSATALDKLQLLDRRQVSDLLRVTIRTLQRLEKRGELEPVRVGKGVRYRATNVARLVNA